VALRLPTASDYCDAVATPRYAFEDPELAGAEPVLTALGLPRAISGNYASVFTLETPDQRRIAVKCFTRSAHAQEERYAAISRTLERLATSWQVGFCYLPRGIRVSGFWHPVLRMEWVEATGLIPWIEAHLDRPEALTGLADEVVRVTGELERAGIAHGDLQHGNLLVDDAGHIRLVDYDGMFVPELARFGSCESGHRHYQSPRRASFFGPELDRFSAWTIHSSLVALARRPALWSELRRPGDETLLFREADYRDPSSSRALEALRRSGDRTLAVLADRLRPLWLLDPSEVPPLGQNGRAAPAKARTARATVLPPAIERAPDPVPVVERPARALAAPEKGAGPSSAAEKGPAPFSEPAPSARTTPVPKTKEKKRGRRVRRRPPRAVEPDARPVSFEETVSKVRAALVTLAGVDFALLTAAVPDRADAGPWALLLQVFVVLAAVLALFVGFRASPELRIQQERARDFDLRQREARVAAQAFRRAEADRRVAGDEPNRGADPERSVERARRRQMAADARLALARRRLDACADLRFSAYARRVLFGGGRA
jgi:hypothetical protein